MRWNLDGVPILPGMKAKDAARWYRFDSPFGAIGYLWDGRRCLRVCLVPPTSVPLPPGDDPVAEWMAGYFRSETPPLPPIAPPPTPFQRRLREALWRIPPGRVTSYGALARRLDSSPRGVGQGLRANRLPLLVPCHRVVAADGIGGFAFGREWKQRLLAMEGYFIR